MTTALPYASDFSGIVCGFRFAPDGGPFTGGEAASIPAVTSRNRSSLPM